MLPFLDILCSHGHTRGLCSVIHTEKYMQRYTERTKYPAGAKTLKVFPAHQPLPLKQPQEAEFQYPKALPCTWHLPHCVQRRALGLLSFRAQMSNPSLFFLKSHSTHLLTRAAPSSPELFLSNTARETS